MSDDSVQPPIRREPHAEQIKAAKAAAERARKAEQDDFDARLRADSTSGPESSQFVLELDRLIVNASQRRDLLLKKGLRRLRLKKSLSVLAGILALTSAGTIAGVLASLLGSVGYQIFAALAAAASGVITLISSVYLVDEEIVSMMTAASKYLALREGVQRLKLLPKVTEEDKYKRAEKFQESYESLDERYSRFR